MKLKEERVGDRVVIHCDETEWIAANRDWLEKTHPGEWIAVEGSELVAVGPDLEQVLAEARAKGVDHPLVDAVRKKEFQGVILVRSPRIIRE